jgi:hypothetical protein
MKTAGCVYQVHAVVSQLRCELCGLEVCRRSNAAILDLVCLVSLSKRCRRSLILLTLLTRYYRERDRPLMKMSVEWLELPPRPPTGGCGVKEPCSVHHIQHLGPIARPLVGTTSSRRPFATLPSGETVCTLRTAETTDTRPYSLTSLPQIGSGAPESSWVAQLLSNVDT